MGPQTHLAQGAQRRVPGELWGSTCPEIHHPALSKYHNFKMNSIAWLYIYMIYIYIIYIYIPDLSQPSARAPIRLVACADICIFYPVQSVTNNFTNIDTFRKDLSPTKCRNPYLFALWNIGRKVFFCMLNGMWVLRLATNVVNVLVVFVR